MQRTTLFACLSQAFLAVAGGRPRCRKQKHSTAMAWSRPQATMLALTDEEKGVIRQSMALRVKYRVQQPDGRYKKTIPLALLGVHPQSRGVPAG